MIGRYGSRGNPVDFMKLYMLYNEGLWDELNNIERSIDGHGSILYYALLSILKKLVFNT